MSVPVVELAYYYQVTAPTRGVVGDIPVRVGDRVTPATQLTSVADISVLEANVSVPVGRANDVKPGHRAPDRRPCSVG